MPFDFTHYARIDSNSANNPALNLTGDSAIQFTFINETASGGSGDYYLDVPSGGGVDPDTQVEIEGASYSFTFELIGAMPTLKKDGAQQVPDQFEGSAVYIITVQDYPTSGETTRLVFMPNEDATATEMDDFGNGAIDIQNLDTTPPDTAICFELGTQITIERGELPVEGLVVGDLVLTQDDGLQPIRWIGRTIMEWPGSDEQQKPILISAGSLGVGIPERDLVVSPQHRILLSGVDVERAFGVDEVLVPAKGLLGRRGVRQMHGRRRAVYFHILLNKHAILQSDGAATESFMPGPMALRMLQTWQKTEVLKLFPALRDDPEAGYSTKARKFLTCRQTTELLAVAKRSKASIVRKFRLRDITRRKFTDTSLPIAA